MSYAGSLRFQLLTSQKSYAGSLRFQLLTSQKSYAGSLRFEVAPRTLDDCFLTHLKACWWTSPDFTCLACPSLNSTEQPSLACESLVDGIWTAQLLETSLNNLMVISRELKGGEVGQVVEVLQIFAFRSLNDSL